MERVAYRVAAIPTPPECDYPRVVAGVAAGNKILPRILSST